MLKWVKRAPPRSVAAHFKCVPASQIYCKKTPESQRERSRRSAGVVFSFFLEMLLPRAIIIFCSRNVLHLPVPVAAFLLSINFHSNVSAMDRAGTEMCDVASTLHVGQRRSKPIYYSGHVI